MRSVADAARRARTLSLKIDACTYEGLHVGVPSLLGLLRRHGVRASFFLAFGPDNSGKALRNVLRRGFLKKMLRTRAATTYGWRTIVSGTLLPARPIASGAPEIVRRIAGDGHEVAVHGWDHRLWQDHVPEMAEGAARAEVERARDACEAILGQRPAGTGAPGWIVTDASLRAQDALGFAYASDLRGGPPCRLSVGGRVLALPQIPTSGTCIEELLSQGTRTEEDLARALRAGIADADAAVFAVHAEIEGRDYAGLFDRLLPVLREGRGDPMPLRDLARSFDPATLPVRALAAVEIPGRSGTVASSAALVAQSEEVAR